MRDAREVVRECRSWLSLAYASSVIEADRRAAKLAFLEEYRDRCAAAANFEEPDLIAKYRISETVLNEMLGELQKA